MALKDLPNNLSRSVGYYKKYGLKRTLKKMLLTAVKEDAETGSVVPAHFFFLPQIIPLRPAKTASSQKRLNIILPSVQIQHVFGGISTALAFFERLGEGYSQQRILVTDAPVLDYDTQRFQEYVVDPARPEDAPKSIVAMHDRFAKTIEVGAGDEFVATAWWTAHILQDLLEWQQKEYQLPPRRFIYLIQDFEPGFYPWSSAYALAESTYRSQFATTAVFNTQLLQRFFEQSGYSFAEALAFEPAMNEQLVKQASTAKTKNRTAPYQILLYGRPSTDRNCFELLVHALALWRKEYGNSRQWQIVSAGEAHAKIDLGEGCYIQALGKLSLAAYAECLERSSVGLSLMLSPHPSYPPLEMAAYGLEVITNSYGPKDLSALSGNIVSLELLTPQSIARALQAACERVEQRQGAAAPVRGRPFNQQDPFAEVMQRLRPQWRGGQ